MIGTVRRLLYREVPVMMKAAGRIRPAQKQQALFEQPPKSGPHGEPAEKPAVGTVETATVHIFGRPVTSAGYRNATPREWRFVHQPQKRHLIACILLHENGKVVKGESWESVIALASRNASL
jgi:hypothetical protein